MVEKYHYTECGLDNVYLSGDGVQLHETKYGKGVSIDNIDALHELIAYDIATSTLQLTGKELRFLRVQLDLSQEKFASLIESTKQNIGRYERDELQDGIPGTAQMAARMLYLSYIHHRDIKAVIERIAELDRQLVGDRLFCSVDEGWQAGDDCIDV